MNHGVPSDSLALEDSSSGISVDGGAKDGCLDDRSIEERRIEERSIEERSIVDGKIDTMSSLSELPNEFVELAERIDKLKHTCVKSNDLMNRLYVESLFRKCQARCLRAKPFGELMSRVEQALARLESTKESQNLETRELVQEVKENFPDAYKQALELKQDNNINALSRFLAELKAGSSVTQVSQLKALNQYVEESEWNSISVDVIGLDALLYDADALAEAELIASNGESEASATGAEGCSLSLPQAEGYSPRADGSLPKAEGSLLSAEGSLPKAEGSSINQQHTGSSPLKSLRSGMEGGSGIDNQLDELRSLQNYREYLGRVVTENMVRQVIKEDPENAGPLNPQRLLVRTISAMKEISPSYVNRLVPYFDSLIWIDESSKD